MIRDGGASRLAQVGMTRNIAAASSWEVRSRMAGNETGLTCAAISCRGIVVVVLLVDRPLTTKVGGRRRNRWSVQKMGVPQDGCFPVKRMASISISSPAPDDTEVQYMNG